MLCLFISPDRFDLAITDDRKDVHKRMRRFFFVSCNFKYKRRENDMPFWGLHGQVVKASRFETTHLDMSVYAVVFHSKACQR